ncbi:MAG TPA: MOSC domain-containing protein [Balneolales bacterium]|nr:MOSC domain-containing protein [Balneolales bacterium]
MENKTTGIRHGPRPKAVGKLERIRRYPVKSMAGKDVDAIYVHETGLNGDRVYAFYDHKSHRKSLPYFTGREKRELVLLKPLIIDEPVNTQPYPDGYHPEIKVALPDENGTYDISDPKLATHITEICLPRKISITLDYRRAGIFDSNPVSIMGVRTVDQIAGELDQPGLDPRRFRENFYIDWDSKEPFFEDDLVGKSLQIGEELLLHVVKKNKRCAMICLDPDTADYDKHVLGTVAKQHETNAGVYAVVRQTGVVYKGDPVVIC